MPIRFCGGRSVSPTWQIGDAKVEATGVAGSSGINILSVMVPPVFDPIREPAPVFRVGGDIPTPTGQAPILVKLRPQLCNLTTTQDQPHFPVLLKRGCAVIFRPDESLIPSDFRLGVHVDGCLGH